MPRIAEIEDTPNPNAKKFILKEPLTWGTVRSYESAEEARGDPLAEALFAIEHVANVFYVDRWITVTQDGKAEWRELNRRIAGPIRAAPAASERSARLAASARPAMDELSPEDQERLDNINALLDEHVRPYLQGDGGDLYVLGLEGSRLVVHYQGACGSCPSSLSGTLAGIESLLRTVDPEIEVVAA
jgi:NFU1 iron-sulfur cluster scaffold homolog, mitochondrial